LFRDYFRRVAKVKSWTTPDELIQHLTLALEGPAAEVLRDFDDIVPTAIDDLWERLKHRFGNVVESREAMRKFEARWQSDTETLVEFEQGLRSMFKLAWPTASTETRDATLKRRFEDVVSSAELLQYLHPSTSSRSDFRTNCREGAYLSFDDENYEVEESCPCRRGT